jgi:hypothetical protein
VERRAVKTETLDRAPEEASLEVRANGKDKDVSEEELRSAFSDWFFAYACEPNDRANFTARFPSRNRLVRILEATEMPTQPRVKCEPYLRAREGAWDA